MRFVDSSVFIYAYLRPLKKLPPELIDAKNRARTIIERISDGEPATTSIIHVSEIANILGARMSSSGSLEILSGLFDLSNLSIIDADRGLYEASIEAARLMNVGVNDAFASLLMRDMNIREVYSFDSDFDRIEGVGRITE